MNLTRRRERIDCDPLSSYAEEEVSVSLGAISRGRINDTNCTLLVQARPLALLLWVLCLSATFCAFRCVGLVGRCIAMDMRAL